MRWYEKQRELYFNKEQSKDSNNTQNERLHADEDSKLTEELLSMIEESVQTSNEAPTPMMNMAQPTAPSAATCIGANAKLTGNIDTEDDLIIHGSIQGDVICRRYLTVAGQILGNVQCETGSFQEADIKGDIHCQSNLELGSGTVLEGNIQSQHLIIGGKVKGDIVVEGSITITSQAMIIGDIQAFDIELQRGAIIKGNVTINQ